jgi:hypothetical protein
MLRFGYTPGPEVMGMRCFSAVTWLLVLPALPGLGCGCSPTPAISADGNPLPGAALRARLGIPTDAKTVVIFGQAAHLDVDWQMTFDGYYQSYVNDIFLEARQILEKEPRAFYSVAEMAYLKQHLLVHPEELGPLSSLAQSGALRIVGGGITSPDTLLPESEMLFRDFLYGSLFSEETLGLRARAAYLPDSFGHSVTAPDILAAAGFESVAFGRVDGAPTLYESLVLMDTTMKPGSNAALLQSLGSADFIWRGPGGGSVLGHYLSDNIYCTGDNIDYDEPLSVPGGHLGPFMGDDAGYTDGMIDSYVQALQPYARTPFLFVPVGCDFQHPKPQLLTYLDGYNQRHYAENGTYAVAASFEDYSDLVLGYRDQLPELVADLTPYFTGFYGSRADVKQGVRAAARPFFSAEIFAALLYKDSPESGLPVLTSMAPELEKLTRSDHHDFITGTAADPVVTEEQLPLLQEAETTGADLLANVAATLAARIPAPVGQTVGRVLALNPSGLQRSEVAEVTVAFSPPLSSLALRAARTAPGGAQDAVSVPLEIISATSAGVGQGYSAATLRLALDDMPPFSFRAIDLYAGSEPLPPATRVNLQLVDVQGNPASGASVARVLLSTGRVQAKWELTQQRGFALTSLELDGVQAIAGPSFQINDYQDMGGLWRLGNEMTGCSLTPIPPAQPGGPNPMDPPAETVSVLESSLLTARVAFQSATAVREAWVEGGSAGLSLALTTAAASGTTRTAEFSFAVPQNPPLYTSLPGGFAQRAPERIYTPTFWPAVNWLSSGPWAMLLTQSTGVRFSATGDVELLAVRNAPSEKCDVLGGKGTDSATHRIEWRIAPAANVAAAELLAQAENRPLLLYPVANNAAPPPGLALPSELSLLTAQGSGVVTAIKLAERGAGRGSSVIIRALLLPGPLTLALSPALANRKLTQVDALERDIKDLGNVGSTLTLDSEHFGTIATLRLDP